MSGDDEPASALAGVAGRAVITIFKPLDRLGPQGGSRLLTLGRERHDGDVGWHDQPLRDVPPGLIDQERAVLARRHPCADLGQVHAHCFGVAPGQHEIGRLRRSAIGEPNLYAVRANARRAPDRVQTRGKTF